MSTEISCRHSISCMNHMNLNLENCIPLFYKKVISSSTVTKLIIGFPFGPTITLLNVSDIFSRASQLELNENLDLLQNPGGIFSESM